MSKRIYFVCIVLIFCCLLGCACQSVPNGMNCKVPGVPRIDKFSTKGYENYEFQFSPVQSAVYKKGETAVSIDPTDERLIAILNFLAYSEEKRYSAIRTGYVEEEEINRYLNTNASILEVHFSHNSESNSSIQSTPKIVILGDSYLMFVDTSKPSWVAGEPDAIVAERIWPYGGLVMDEFENYEKLLSFEADMGTGYWIDLLEYAGFFAEAQ